MKVLFVTLCSLETNTSVTKSNIGILTGLKELGHDVTIVMPELDGSVSYYDDSYDLANYKIIRFKSVGLGNKIAALNSSPSKIKQYVVGVLRQMYQKLSIFDRTKEFLNCASELPIYDTYFDAVISTSDPKTSHLYVERMIEKGLKYGKWIQHWGDPLSGDISSALIYPQSYIKRVEKNIIKNADKVVYVSPFTAEVQKRNYPEFAEKLHFVPLACDQPTEQCPVISTTENGKLSAVYLGDYSSHIRNIMPLYNAVSKMKNIRLTIAGGTDLVLSNTDNITILPRVKQDKVKELESNASVIISVGNLSGTQIPGKLYYAASTQKTILVTVDGDNKEEMFKYLNSFNRFDVCSNTENSIKESLECILASGDKKFSTPARLLPKNVANDILA